MPERWPGSIAIRWDKRGLEGRFVLIWSGILVYGGLRLGRAGGARGQGRVVGQRQRVRTLRGPMEPARGARVSGLACGAVRWSLVGRRLRNGGAGRDHT